MNFFKTIYADLKDERKTLVKLINFLAIYVQTNFLHNSKVYGFPTSLSIDPVNVCNLQCPLCPTGRKDKMTEKNFMRFDMLKKIMDEVGKYLYKIDLYNWGEPFLNKELLKMIKYAVGAGVKVDISSNLSFDTDSYVPDIVDSGLNELIVSAAGSTEKEYEKYNIGGDFKKVMKNVGLIAKEKRKKNSKTPTLIWRYLVTRYNEKGVEEALRTHKSRGFDSILVSTLHLDMGGEITRDVRHRIEEFKDWLPEENEKYSGYDIQSKSRIRQNSCDRLWRTSVISPSGEVFPCCAVYGDKYSFGSIQKSTFMQIWNNKYYRSARSSISGKSKRKIRTICDICKKNGYLDVSTI
ncbi:SPASM domain-containing protein [bacterium]|nr:SPASM domain-containing protein [bacterium]